MVPGAVVGSNITVPAALQFEQGADCCAGAVLQGMENDGTLHRAAGLAGGAALHDLARDRPKILQPTHEPSKVTSAVKTISLFIQESLHTGDEVGGCGSCKRTLTETGCNLRPSFFLNSKARNNKVCVLS